MADRIKYFIIAGKPGVGKTTLTKKLSGLVNEMGIITTGFYTEEVKKNTVREGFDVVTLEGRRARLARVQSRINSPNNYKVGKYTVLIQEFESVALSSLNEMEDYETCLVIDEIGKMELFSEFFKKRIKELFSPDSKSTVLATIPIVNGDPLIEYIRYHTRAKVWTLTTENRDIIHEDILQEMKASLIFEGYNK